MIMLKGRILATTAAAALVFATFAAPGLAEAKDMNAHPNATHPTGAQTTGAATDTSAKTASEDAKPIQDLQRAAQRLRDATHDMVRETATAKRNRGIRKVDRTLEEVQDAMVSLPSNLFLAGAEQSEPQKAGDNLQRATDRLNDAVQALKTDGSANQSASVKAIKEALAQVQQERMNLANQSASK
jgi:hypothetical protein